MVPFKNVASVQLVFSPLVYRTIDLCFESHYGMRCIDISLFPCSGSGDTLSISDEQTIDEYVKYYHIKVSAILVPNDERLPMAYYDSVAQLTGGSSHVIRESRHRTVKTYVALLDSFRNLLWEHRGPVSQVMIMIT